VISHKSQLTNSAKNNKSVFIGSPRKAWQPCDTWGLRAAKPCCRRALWWHFCFANPV